MNTETQKNISNSIVLMGPCAVGKSLIAAVLSQKTSLPKLDIDDLLFFIEAELRGNLSNDKTHQDRFIKAQLEELEQIKRETPLTESESEREQKLVYEFVDLYNYYYNLLGGYEKFYEIFYEYYTSTKQITTLHGEIKKLNKATIQLLNKIFESTNTSFIISPPASFGWNSNNPLHFKTQISQKETSNFLDLTQNILLQPGDDYTLRIPTDKSSVNYKLFLRHPEFYYKNADLEISTNGLFYNPENDFLKQRTWLNVRETLTKEKLKNQSEVNNICDQILFHLRNKNKGYQILSK